MEEQKMPVKNQVVQSTLDHFEVSEADDSQYGHLVDHLVASRDSRKVNEMWTRVFGVDGDNDLLPSVFPFGQDLIYNESLRESMRSSAVLQGEVIFSPKHFKVKDIAKDIAEVQMPLEELYQYGRLASKVKKQFNHGEDEMNSSDSRDNCHKGDVIAKHNLALNREYNRKRNREQ